MCLLTYPSYRRHTASVGYASDAAVVEALSISRKEGRGETAQEGPRLTGEASNVVYLISPVSSIRAKAAKLPTWSTCSRSAPKGVSHRPELSGVRSDRTRAATHIVRRGKDGDQPPVVLDAVPTLPDLVRADHGRDLVQLGPATSHVRSEPESDPSLRRSATVGVLRVGPQHLAHEAFLSRLFERHPRNLADVVERDAVL